MIQTGDFDFDGTPDSDRVVYHATDSENAIGEVSTRIGTGSPTTQTVVTDIAGNLTFDGTYWYQYDGWNRLIEVRSAGTLDPNDFEENGTLSPAVGHAAGSVVASYIYDGLGQLAPRRVAGQRLRQSAGRDVPVRGRAAGPGASDQPRRVAHRLRT